MALVEWNEDQDKHAEKRLVKTVKGKYGVEARRLSSVLLGKIYESRKEYKSAQTYYRKALSLQPSQPESTEIEWRIGWMEYRMGNYKKAGSLFMNAHKKARESERDGGFLYWAARSFEKAGDEKRAKKALEALIQDFPNTYYGSKMSGGQRALTAVPASFMISSDISTVEPVLDERGARFLKRFGALAELDEKESARLEAAQLAGSLKDDYDSLLWLSKLYSGSNDAPSSIKTAWRAISKLDDVRKKDYLETGWKALYPALHWDTVSKESERRGLDPFLALSIIRQESLFDPQAVSAANARGLMQLMPSTAKTTNGMLVKDGGSGVDFKEAELFEPETNIRLGVAHFSTLVGKYGGNLVRSIAAYNAGATPVDKWIERFGSLDDDEFVEMIPYLETKNYVKKVLRNVALYWRIYGNTAVKGNEPTANLKGSGAVQ
jgi:soluble lytic murein transglycosylase